MSAAPRAAQASKPGRCEFLAKCPFFNERMSRMPKSVEIVKNRFCRDKYEECARWRVHKALGASKVPGNLFPAEANEATELIARHRAGK